MLGARLVKAHAVVPLAEGHALSVGIFSYEEHLHLGLYADPEALPDVRELPQALDTALLALVSALGFISAPFRAGRQAGLRGAERSKPPSPLGARPTGA
jgi:hypothetical protein